MASILFNSTNFNAKVQCKCTDRIQWFHHTTLPTAPPCSSLSLSMGYPQPLFRLFSIFSQKIQPINVKICQSSIQSWIQTHNLLHISLLPKPLSFSSLGFELTTSCNISLLPRPLDHSFLSFSLPFSYIYFAAIHFPAKKFSFLRQKFFFIWQLF